MKRLVFYLFLGALAAGLLFERPASAQWTISTVDTTEVVGGNPSIAVDPNGKVHIVYLHDTVTDKLKYATNASGGTFTTGYLFSGITAGSDSPSSQGSIAVDTSKVHLCYYYLTDQGLRYAEKGLAATYFVPVGLDGAPGTTDADVGRNCSIAVDGSGKIHISYFNQTSGSIKYASKPSGGSWTKSTIAGTASSAGPWNSLAVEAGGTGHVSYYHDATGTTDWEVLRYQEIPTSGLLPANQLVDGVLGGTDSDVGKYNSVAVDSTGKLHVCYRREMSASDFDLVYASSASGAADSWTYEVLDSPGDWDGLYCSIAIGGNPELIHISHVEQYWNIRNLVYSWKEADSTSALQHETVVSGDWSVPEVSSPLQSDIAVDSAGGVHIAFYDANSSLHNLVYAHRSSSPVFCGNGICDSGETCSTCVADCGACPPACGNGTCDAAAGETTATCPSDCPGVAPLPPTCGNGTCAGGETCASCAADCGPCPPTPAACGNGVVEPGEACDDGNTASGDGCNSTCQTELVAAATGGDVTTGGTSEAVTTGAGAGTTATEAPTTGLEPTTEGAPGPTTAQEMGETTGQPTQPTGAGGGGCSCTLCYSSN